MSKKTMTLVTAALMAALTCIATMVIMIPSPLKGYLNLGDCLVLISGWILPPVYGFLAAGLGSSLADIFSGYVLYAPVTFLIKGLMAVIACYGAQLLQKKTGTLAACVISGAAAEFLMVLGYFIFESILYGITPSMVNIPANAIQGIAGLTIGVAIMKALEHSNILSK